MRSGSLHLFSVRARELSRCWTGWLSTPRRTGSLSGFCSLSIRPDGDTRDIGFGSADRVEDLHPRTVSGVCCGLLGVRGAVQQVVPVVAQPVRQPSGRVLNLSGPVPQLLPGVGFLAADAVAGGYPHGPVHAADRGDRVAAGAVLANQP